MRMRFVYLVLIPIMLCGNAFVSHGRDMRVLSIDARKVREGILQRAAAEKAAASRAEAESRKRISGDRETLKKAILDIENKNHALARDIQIFESELDHLKVSERHFIEKIEKTDDMIKELVSVIRVNAKDIDALLKQNPRNAYEKTIPCSPTDIADPGMDDVRVMAAALDDLIQSHSEVFFKQGTIIDRSGREVNSEVLFLGPFTALYRCGGETGFLNFSSAGGKLFALSRLPSTRMQNRIAKYMDGQSEIVPIDITRGGALRQLAHAVRLWERIPNGGPIVWPILAILGVGGLIVIERTFFLLRKRFNAERLIRQIEKSAMEGNRQNGLQACAEYAAKPVARVLQAGLACCHMRREEMENALQEAILKEIPSMERFLSTLGMLAAIAPLLGLLGTVTGMIDTFHVITLYGTGDPRLMSGGISEALVTTMLGLSVAIPLMLSQTLLNRAVDNAVGQMEEKAVALVNIIQKSREMS